MNLVVRHVTPGLGVLPRNVETEACSGLIGVAIGTARAQSELGYVTQLFGWNPGAHQNSWSIGDIAVRSTPGWPRANFGPYDFRVTGPLITMGMRSEPPDMLHAYTDPHLLISRTRRLRILHYQTPVPEHPSWTYTQLVNRADAIVCCGEFIRNQFLQRVDFPADRVFEVNNGINLEQFADANSGRLRADWGVSRDKVTILFAGALVPEKGLLILLKALQGIKNVSRLQVLIAGTAALWLTPEHAGQQTISSYEKEVREHARGLSIQWLGSVPMSEMPDLHAAADICVVPSTWDDPFPLVACEAMAAGTPVIASARGGLSQIVIDGETGFLVPSDDPEALRNSIETLVSNGELRAGLGANAQDRAQKFSWTGVARQIESIYSDLSREHGSPDKARINYPATDSSEARRAR
jgi:glycosyltransferase involved in cell wall biosynthesis